MTPSTPIISHFIVKLQLGVLPNDLKYIEDKCNELIKELGLNVVNKVSHQFPVQGVTIAYVLSQSHLVVHTWPELNWLHIDIATCIHLSENKLDTSLRKVFESGNLLSLKLETIG